MSKSKPYLNGIGILITSCTANTALVFTLPINKATTKPMTKPRTIDDKRIHWLLDRLSMIIEMRTKKPRKRLDKEPQNSGLLSNNHCPPAKSVNPTLIKLIPIIVITVPVTSGVISFLSCGKT